MTFLLFKFRLYIVWQVFYSDSFENWLFNEFNESHPLRTCSTPLSHRLHFRTFRLHFRSFRLQLETVRKQCGVGAFTLSDYFQAI